MNEPLTGGLWGPTEGLGEHIVGLPCGVLLTGLLGPSLVKAVRGAVNPWPVPAALWAE